MSIWTCNRSLLAAASAVFLSGCLQAPDVSRREGGTFRMPPETVTVAGRSVVIGGPEGYCVDRSASRLRSKTAFVLLGSCASIAGDARAGAPSAAGILTASVSRDTGSGPAIDAVIDQMAAYLTTPTGRAALARDGDAGSVEVLDSRREDGALFIHLRDTSAEVFPGLAQDYWRGLFDINGHLVTVSVVGFADQPMSTDTGLQVLRGFHARIRNETQRSVSDVRPPQRRLFGNLLN
ncbi:MAG: hypothetical protein QNJ44_15995 [Rhodobacter sp.]|nr:hypothetical protein [Rhodobacter sp.]